MLLARSASCVVRRTVTCAGYRQLCRLPLSPSQSTRSAGCKHKRQFSVFSVGQDMPASSTYSNVSGTHWTVELMPSFFPETKIAKGEVGEYETDLLAIGVFAEAFEVKKGEDDTETVVCVSKALLAKDDSLNGAIGDIVAKGDFKGEAGQSAVVRAGGKVKNVGLFGLGKRAEAKLPSDWGRSVFYKMGGGVGNSAKGQKCASVAVEFDSAPEPGIADVTTHLIHGMLLEPYEATRYKEKPKKNPLKSISLMNFDPAAESGVKKGYAFAKGASLTQYLVESPANVCYPQHLADAAKMIADAFPDTFSLKVLEKADCEKMNMGLYLAVANASGEKAAPKFIHLKYSKGTPKANVALVGKGITFDTGGYNLKVQGGIEEMKTDMGGAGAVFGAAYTLGLLAPDDVSVHCIVAACENMIAGDGYRPGDIIKASNGKSVEVINTDAEGRLTLADALLYAQNECKATSIVDAATLTGAKGIALGRNIAALFTPSDAMAKAVEEASKRTGDRVWRMPLEAEYLDALTKGIADLKNVGPRYGGAITAALFLQEFVKKDEVEWAHLDIAGNSWNPDQNLATGYGAALFTEWVLALPKA